MYTLKVPVSLLFHKGKLVELLVLVFMSSVSNSPSQTYCSDLIEC
jgi:hypothetical protein